MTTITTATAYPALRVLLDSVLGHSIADSELARLHGRSPQHTSLQMLVISKNVFGALDVDRRSLIIVDTSMEWIVNAVLSMNGMTMSVALSVVALRATTAFDIVVVAVSNIVLGMLLKAALAVGKGSLG